MQPLSLQFQILLLQRALHLLFQQFLPLHLQFPVLLQLILQSLLPELLLQPVPGFLLQFLLLLLQPLPGSLPLQEWFPLLQ